MKRTKQTTALCAGTLATAIMAVPLASYAIGPSGPGFGSIGTETYNIQDLGPLDGPWKVQGGTDAFASVLNNASPDAAGHSINTSVSMGSVYIHIVKPTGLLQFHMNAGLIQTPIMGLTTNNSAVNSVAPYGSPYNPYGPAVLSWWLTLQPSQYWDINVGKLPTQEGIEGIAGLTNPTFFLSALNFMQTISGYGVGADFYYGPATLTLQLADSYETHRYNILSGAFTYNLNSDGSDYVAAYGHTTVGHSGNPGQPQPGVGFGFNIGNSTLVGVGGQYTRGPWVINPEIQFQWLPKGSVAVGSGDPRPLTTYYNVAAMTYISYAINQEWSVIVQPQYIYQNGDKNDPNEALFGNWLQYGSPLAPGSFSPGMSLLGLQANVTWQKQNFFVRPDIAYNHLIGYQSGTGYGLHGTAANQVVAVLDIGFLIE